MVVRAESHLTNHRLPCQPWGERVVVCRGGPRLCLLETGTGVVRDSPESWLLHRGQRKRLWGHGEQGYRDEWKWCICCSQLSPLSCGITCSVKYRWESDSLSGCVQITLTGRGSSYTRIVDAALIGKGGEDLEHKVQHGRGAVTWSGIVDFIF